MLKDCALWRSQRPILKTRSNFSVTTRQTFTTMIKVVKVEVNTFLVHLREALTVMDVTLSFRKMLLVTVICNFTKNRLLDKLKCSYY